jgi:hypothetical protein
MAHRVGPWWLGYFLISPPRRWWQNPTEILDRYIGPAMTAVEPGPGTGFLTLEFASIGRAVGQSGRCRHPT